MNRYQKRKENVHFGKKVVKMGISFERIKTKKFC